MKKKLRSQYVIGVDIGGTSIRSGLVSETGNVRRKSYHWRNVDSKGSREHILESFASPLRANLRQASQEGIEVVGIGIGMCGPLDYDRGICLIHGVDKYESLYGVDLKNEFRQHLGLSDEFPIHFEVDAWTFARGEEWRGSARGFRRVVAITLGSGFGSAFLVEGQPVSDGPGVPPPYGWLGGLPFQDGKLDDYLSRRGILALHRSLTPKNRRIATTWDVKDIAHSAVAGDKISRKAFREFGDLLGRSIAPNLEEFQADCLILGGRISQAFDLFGPPLRKGLTALPLLNHVSVARSIRLAAIWGAGRLALIKSRITKNKKVTDDKPRLST